MCACKLLANMVCWSQTFRADQLRFLDVSWIYLVISLGIGVTVSILSMPLAADVSTRLCTCAS